MISDLTSVITVSVFHIFTSILMNIWFQNFLLHLYVTIIKSSHYSLEKKNIFLCWYVCPIFPFFHFVFVLIIWNTTSHFGTYTTANQFWALDSSLYNLCIFRSQQKLGLSSLKVKYLQLIKNLRELAIMNFKTTCNLKRIIRTIIIKF